MCVSLPWSVYKLGLPSLCWQFVMSKRAVFHHFLSVSLCFNLCFSFSRILRSCLLISYLCRECCWLWMAYWHWRPYSNAVSVLCLCLPWLISSCRHLFSCLMYFSFRDVAINLNLLIWCLVFLLLVTRVWFSSSICSVSCVCESCKSKNSVLWFTDVYETNMFKPPSVSWSVFLLLWHQDLDPNIKYICNSFSKMSVLSRCV